MALFLVPWPEPHLWPIFAGAVVLHFAYKLTMALAYVRAPYTVVYPVVRGTGPLFAVIGASVVSTQPESSLTVPSSTKVNMPGVTSASLSASGARSHAPAFTT